MVQQKSNNLNIQAVFLKTKNIDLHCDPKVLAYFVEDPLGLNIWNSGRPLPFWRFKMKLLVRTMSPSLMMFGSPEVFLRFWSFVFFIVGWWRDRDPLNLCFQDVCVCYNMIKIWYKYVVCDLFDDIYIYTYTWCIIYVYVLICTIYMIFDLKTSHQLSYTSTNHIYISFI